MCASGNARVVTMLRVGRHWQRQRTHAVLIMRDREGDGKRALQRSTTEPHTRSCSSFSACAMQAHGAAAGTSCRPPPHAAAAARTHEVGRGGGGVQQRASVPHREAGEAHQRALYDVARRVVDERARGRHQRLLAVPHLVDAAADRVGPLQTRRTSGAVSAKSATAAHAILPATDTARTWHATEQ